MSASPSLTAALVAVRNPYRAALSPSPQMLPLHREDAYRVRDAVIHRLGLSTCGWKLGALSSEVQKAEGYDGPIPGRILADCVFESGSCVSLPAKSQPKIECELAVRLKETPADWGCESSPTSAELGELADIFLSFDITASRYAADWMNRASARERMLAQLADNGNGGFVVLDSEPLSVVPVVPDETNVWEVRLILNGRPAADAKKQMSVADYLMPPLRWIFCHAEACELPLKKDDLILTGSLTQPVPVTSGDLAAACFSTEKGSAQLSVILN